MAVWELMRMALAHLLQVHLKTRMDFYSTSAVRRGSVVPFSHVGAIQSLALCWSVNGPFNK